jgi:RNA polymerase sigma-70 factor, ECF subfamily
MAQSMMYSPSDAEFRVIFEREFGYVMNTVRRLGVREADLEDLVHDVFLTFHKRLADYDPSRPLRPWLFGIAYRVVADHRRLARNRNELLGKGDEEKVDSSRGVEELVAAERDRNLVLRALQSIPDERRAVFLLHDLDGANMPEIAHALSIPLNTGYSRLRLARRDFRLAVKHIRGDQSHG